MTRPRPEYYQGGHDRYEEELGRWAVERTHEILVAQFGFDPGTHLADLLLAQHGDAQAQFRVHDWLTERVKAESAHGLNARTRTDRLISTVIADLYTELVDGKPLGDRETMATKAEVAKGTFVRFRARIFDPLWAELRAYRDKAALAARHLKIPRSRGGIVHWKGRRRDLRVAPYGTVRNQRGGETILRPPDED